MPLIRTVPVRSGTPSVPGQNRAPAQGRRRCRWQWWGVARSTGSTRPRSGRGAARANGLPSFTLVGLAETEVKESRERVRAALQQSGFAFPHNKRITVNLAPADLPKESGRFDLPIALGILAADGQIDPARLAGITFAGELAWPATCGRCAAPSRSP